MKIRCLQSSNYYKNSLSFISLLSYDAAVDFDSLLLYLECRMLLTFVDLRGLLFVPTLWGTDRSGNGMINII